MLGKCTPGIDRLFLVDGIEGVLFSSSDQGVTWNPLAGGGLPTPLSGGAIVTDGAGRLFLQVGNSLYRSDDTGASWSLVSAASISGRMAVDSRGCIYQVTPTSVLRSSDRGVTWQIAGEWDAASGGGNVAWYGVTTDAAGKVYVINGLNAKIYQSADHGASFQYKGSFLGDHLSGALTTLADGSLYAYGPPDSVTNKTPIVRSTNEGATWTQVGIIPKYFAGELTSTVSGDLYAASYIGTLDVYRSTDKGMTWQPQATLPKPGGCGAKTSITADYPYAQSDPPCAPLAATIPVILK